jgi:RNA polymerase II-associated protein 3
MQSSLDSSLANKRRRVPIKIIEPPSAAAPSTTLSVGSLKPHDSRVLTSSQAVISASANVKTDTLEPVSSRSLKLPTVDASSRNSKGSFTAESGLIDNDTNLPSKVKTLPTLTPPANPTNGVLKPNSFKDVKQARENAKPSRVGGGIFRASGSNTILATRNDGDSNVADLLKSGSSTSSSSMGLSARDDSKTSYTPVLKAPNTLFDFMKSWGSLRSTEEKWHLITVSIFRVIVRPILTLLTASYRAFLLLISQRCVKPLSNLLCSYPSCSVSWLYWMLRQAIPGSKPSFESIWRILRGYLGLIP